MERMSLYEAKLQLSARSQDEKLVRLSVPFIAGFLAPLSTLKSYLLMKDFIFNLEYTGGWLTKEYVLTIRDIMVGEALDLIRFLEAL